MIDVLDSFPITILYDNHVVLWYEGGIICSICALIYNIYLIIVFKMRDFSKSQCFIPHGDKSALWTA